MIKISVVVPIFNGEFYLREALDSLVNQTIVNDIEVIMVDDGSTDNSRHIIDEYALNYENFYAFHLENRGVTFARNFGIELSEGEYIHLMDADDYLDYKAYEKLYDLASRYNHDVVMGNFLRFNSRRTWNTDIPDFIYQNLQQPIEDTTLIKNKELAWDMFIWNKLYKRDFLNKNNIRFPNKNLTFQDNLFSIQIYVKAKSVGMLTDYIYFWRARENKTSITQVINIKWATDRFEILNMVHEFVENNITNEDVKYVKYLKWLNLDLPNLIRKVKEFPKKDHEFLFENLNQIINLVPNEYFAKQSSYNKILFTMVKNKDWDVLIKFITYNLKNNPSMKLDIPEKYISKLDLKKDSETEKLNLNTVSTSFKHDNIYIKFNYSIAYADKNEPHEITAFLINNEYKIPISKKNNNELIIPLTKLDLSDYKIKIIYKSKSLIKESFLKTNSRTVFHQENTYLNIYYDKQELIHLKKNILKNNTKIPINLNLDDEKITFNGNFKNIEKVIITDILSFRYFETNINDENNKFNIYYKDLLNSPVKKWEITTKNGIRLELNKIYKKYTDYYFIQVKNYGNKVLIEMTLYENLKKINELMLTNEKLIQENNNLKKIVEKLKNKKHDKKDKKDDTISKSINIIHKLNLFDENYYLNTYPEVKQKDMDPLEHYLLIGFKEGKNPSKDFDTRFYIDMYDDVRESGINPLIHYALKGLRENRVPSPFANYLNRDTITEEKFLTKRIVQYYDLPYINNWDYYQKVINIIKNLEDIETVLEIGPYKTNLINNSDVMDMTNKYAKHYPLKANKFYKQNYMDIPYPIENKKYDLVIICQITKYMPSLVQNKKIFEEIKRISDKLIVTFPSEINEDMINNWTNNKKHLFEHQFNNKKIRIYDFHKE